MTPQQCLYEAMRDRLPQGFSFEEFESILNGWEVIPIYEGDELIGAAIRNGHEVHVGFIRQGNFIRGAIQEVIGKTLREHGKVTTSVWADNVKGLSFCRRLGFKKKWEQGGIIAMECVRCNYV